MTTQFLPQDIITTLEKKYRPNSIKIFSFSLQKIFQEVFPSSSSPAFNPNHFLQFNKIKKYITSKEHNLNVQRNLIMGLFTILTAIPKDSKLENVYKKYEQLLDKINKANKKAQQYAEPTEAEKEDYIPFNDVVSLREIYAKKATENNFWDIDIITDYTPSQLRLFQKYLLLSLYTYLPPLRGEEYINTVILSPSVKSHLKKDYEKLAIQLNKNLIDLKNKKLIVFHYKTSISHGTRVIKLPIKLIEIISQSNEHNQRIKPSSTPYFPLLPNTQKLREGIIEPITIKNLTSIFYSIFEPRQISTSMLRKIYISDYLSKIKDPRKRKELAHQMGHSLETQEFIYSKFRKI